MQGHHGSAQKVTFATLLITLGIIYGDIGTSPLYTFKAIVGKKAISELLVLGGVSCIIWTLTIQTTIKYVILTLNADNDGEGGVFSLYALVRRYGKKLFWPTMIGAATLLADGVLTPAVSVTSAIEGLKSIKGLQHLHVVPIVLVVISIIFIAQRFGTHKVGKVFGPIMTAWFVLLLSIGVFQVWQMPEVLKAFNPKYAIQLLTEYPQGFWILGAVFLCTTGAEAMYSDLGHCGKKNIRLTWSFVKVCLIFNYLGQAAWLMQHQYQHLHGCNPFFEMFPNWLLLPSILFATVAATVASQALISGSFTLINEAINLNFWQRVLVKQPSESKGQIYVPSVNLILWAGCSFMVIYFQTSSNMEAAYGLAITLTMLMTSILLLEYLLYKKRWNFWLAHLVIAVFVVIEVCFFIANSVKIMDGGYITVLLASLFFMVMYVTFFTRKINNRYTKFVNIRPHLELLDQLSKDDNVPKLAEHLVYLTKANKDWEIEERLLKSILSKTPKRADVYWFLHVHRTNAPYTLEYEINELLDDKVVKVNINMGFRIQPRTEMYLMQIMNDLIESKEIRMHERSKLYKPYNNSINLKFVVIEKYLSIENEFKLREGFILKTYFFLKQFAPKDVEAFGLEKSDVIVEQVPLVYNQVKTSTLSRVNH